MSTCNLDHNLDDVRKKLAEQAPFLPEEIHTNLSAYLSDDLPQERLNEIFHLLKKYDLSTQEEQALRNEKFKCLLAN